MLSGMCRTNQPEQDWGTRGSGQSPSGCPSPATLWVTASLEHCVQAVSLGSNTTLPGKSPGACLIMYNQPAINCRFIVKKKKLVVVFVIGSGVGVFWGFFFQVVGGD